MNDDMNENMEYTNYEEQNENIDYEDGEQTQKKGILNILTNLSLVSKICVTVILISIIAIAIRIFLNSLTPNEDSNSNNDEENGIIFASNAKSIVEFAINDTKTNNKGNSCYSLNTINRNIENQVITSPFGSNYSNDSHVKITKTLNGSYLYSVCLIDEDSNILSKTSPIGDDDNIVVESSLLNNSDAQECKLPQNCK